MNSCGVLFLRISKVQNTGSPQTFGKKAMKFFTYSAFVKCIYP